MLSRTESCDPDIHLLSSGQIVLPIRYSLALAMDILDRVRCNDCLNLIKQSMANQLFFHGQSYSLFVGEPKPLSLELIFQNPVFFDEIVDDCLLVAVKPTGQCDDQKLKGMYDVRHCKNRLTVILFDNNIIRIIRIFAPYGVWPKRHVL